MTRTIAVLSHFCERKKAFFYLFVHETLYMLSNGLVSNIQNKEFDDLYRMQLDAYMRMRT